MPRPRRLHADLRTTWFERASSQLASLLVIGAIGTAALSASGAETAARAAAAVGPSVTGVQRQNEAVVAHGATRLDRGGSSRVHHAANNPPPGTARTGTGSPGRKHEVTRWTPDGIGMWIYQWSLTSHGNAGAIVARARRSGLTTLYLRTGSSWDGLSGARHLRQLLMAAASSNIRVVAWDFPRLRRPGVDAQRLARVAQMTVGPHHLRVAAVAPDIETPAEGTFNATWRVRQYLQTLRRLLPPATSVLTAVPWPSSYRIHDYPYRAVAENSDVLIPMAYWYNNSPVFVTERSIDYLRRFHRPVAPVGQGYDGRLDVPGLRHNNLSKQVPAFLEAAHRAGVQAVSVWSWQAAPMPVWQAIERNHHLFSSHHH